MEKKHTEQPPAPVAVAATGTETNNEKPEKPKKKERKQRKTEGNHTEQSPGTENNYGEPDKPKKKERKQRQPKKSQSTDKKKKASKPTKKTAAVPESVAEPKKKLTGKKRKTSDEPTEGAGASLPKKKRTPGAYMLFAQSTRPMVLEHLKKTHESFETMSSKEKIGLQGKQTGAMWRALSDEERDLFKQKAADLKNAEAPASSSA